MMRYLFLLDCPFSVQKKMDSWDDEPLVPKGYAPSAYGPSDEVWHNSMRNLIDLTVRTIKDLYNPRAYSESYEHLHRTLYGGLDNPMPIKERLKGNDRFGTFRTDKFYDTFKHWCKYYGNSKDGTQSFGYLTDKEDFMKELLDGVEERFCKEFGLKKSSLLTDAVQSFRERIKDASSFRMNPQQLQSVQGFLQEYGGSDIEKRKDATAILYKEVMKFDDVKRCPASWRDDAVCELADLVYGRIREDHSNGMKR